MRPKSPSLHRSDRLTAAGIALALLILLSRCPQRTAAAELFHERWRPQFHFTPASNWMNDPNGMVFYDGEYHLFFQHNPSGIQWGHMSWGHAVSEDLVHWQHLPIALYEENDVMIFSGSAVVDWRNTSGFGRQGKPPLVAIYTGHYTAKPLQNQQLAFSNDRGRTWIRYEGNPVLDIGEKDFRDPKVFWHEPTQRWVMAVSWPTHRQIRFYASPDLKHWTHLSDFGPAGATRGIWECPDLFPVSIEGYPADRRWVLVVNVGSGAPAGGSGCQYFVGDFDGQRFTLDPSYPVSWPEPGVGGKTLADTSGPQHAEAALWADWGRDFYAAVSWNDVPARDGRRLWLGWMSNWEYANDVPTTPWRSAMSLPRELHLRRGINGLRLVQQPVRELAKLRAAAHLLGRSTVEKANAWLRQLALSSPSLEVSVEWERVARTAELELHLDTGAGQRTVIRALPGQGQLTVDRTHSGEVAFHPKFAGIYSAPMQPVQDSLRLRLFLDASSLEVFGQDGEVSLTSLILPQSDRPTLQLRASPGAARVRRIQIWELRSAVR